MKTSQRGIDLIKSFEGLRLDAYLDIVGVPTIGYGTTDGVQLGQTITEPAAEAYLSRDLGVFERGVSELVKTPLTDNEFDALVSFAYNLGLAALKGSTLLKKVNAMDYEGAGEEFLRWDHAGGKQVAGLTRRRKAERALFLNEA